MKTRLYKNPPPYFIVLASSVKTKEVEVIEFHRMICNAPKIYPPPPCQNSPPPFLPLYATLPESIPASQNVVHFQQLYMTFPESITPSQNIPLFSISTSDAPRIYPSLPDYTPPPLFHYYMRCSQNLPLPSRIPHPFFYHHMRNLPLSPRINPLFYYCMQHS